MWNRKNIRFVILAGIMGLSVLHGIPASAHIPAEAGTRLRSIFQAREFNARSFQATWLRDGSSYLVL